MMTAVVLVIETSAHLVQYSLMLPEGTVPKGKVRVMRIRRCPDGGYTLAPPAAAFATSFTHWSRLALREAVEHICPIACEVYECLSSG